MPDDIIKAKIVFDTSSLRDLNVGTGTAGGGKGLGGMAEGPKIKEISGTLKTSGKSLAKAGVVAGATAAGIGILVGFAKKSWDAIKIASPRLQASLKIMTKGIALMLRPIGDLLSMYLRPFALSFLRYSVGFYKWWAENKEGIKKAFDTIGEILSGEWFVNKLLSWLFGEDFDLSEKIMEWVGLDKDAGILDMINKSGELMGAAFVTVRDAIFDAGVWTGEKVRAIGEAIFNAGVWTGEKLREIGTAIFDAGVSAGEAVGAFLDSVADFGVKMGEKAASLLETFGNFRDKLSVKLSEFLAPVEDFGVKMGENAKTALDAVYNFGVMLGQKAAAVLDAMQSFASAVADKIRGLGERAGKRVAQFFHGDALITSRGTVHNFDPQDNILAFKGNKVPEGLGGGGSVNVTINLSLLHAQDVSDSVLNSLGRAVTDVVQRDMFRATSEGSGGF